MSKRTARLFLCANLLAAGALAQSTAPPAITSTSPLPSGAVNSAYSFQFTGSNCPQCPWSLFSGTLPPGLSLNSLGLLSGNPSQAGTFNFVIELGTFRTPLTKAFQATINPAATLTIVTQNQLQPVTANTNYSQKFVAINGIGALKWSLISGTIPPGTKLDPDTGVLEGVPFPNGTYEFSIEVKDTQNRTATKFFVLFVRAPLLFNDASPLPNGAVGVPYNVILDADGGVPPYKYSFVSGTVPPGLNYNPSGSVLNGAPLNAGTSSFTVRVTDDEGTVTNKTFQLTIAPGLTILTAALPDALLNTPYTHTFAGANGRTPYTWAISQSELPPGLTLNAATGVFSGTPTRTGAYPMNVRLTDTAAGATSKNLTLTVRDPSGPGLVASAISVVFKGVAGGENPPAQFLALVSTDGNRVPYTATVQSQGNWLRPRPLKGTTPVRMQVGVVTDGLAEGSYPGRITIVGGGRTIVVEVTLDLVRAVPVIDVAPDFLRFIGTPSQLVGDFQQLTIRSPGAPRLPFTTSVRPGSPWLSIAPASGEAVKGSPAFARVSVNPAGLARGAHRGVVSIESALGRRDIPVTMVILPPGPGINVPAGGRFFDLRAGAGLSDPRPFVVQSVGDAPASWTAKILSGDEWLRLTPSTGQTAPGRADSVTLRADPGSLPPGVYYALVEVSAPGAFGSPQYVVCVMRLREPAGSPIPEPSPQGLLFTAGGPAQSVQLFTSSSQGVPYQASAATDDGAEWLSASPALGSASAGSPAKVDVAVKATGLPPGIYTGDVTFSFASLDIRSVNVTLVVPPAVAASASKERSAAGCTPTKLAMVHSAVANSFSSPAGWPIPLGVTVSDDCGDPVTNATVTASFTSGDPALTMRLTNPTTAFYTATWTPRGAAPQVVVSARASATGLAPATAEIIGGVSANLVPSLAANGTLNNLHPEIGAPVAPGTVVAIFGENLASVTESPNQLPLAPNYKGTRVIVGGREAPLYFVSPGQINAQMPTELDPTLPQAVIVQSGSAITQPEPVALAPAKPGVAKYADGTVIAQHNDFTLITADSPARAGEAIVIYLVGMGATKAPVATGQPSPVNPLPAVSSEPIVTVGGKQATLFYAGLTPGAAGLYQINFAVPDLPPGTHTIVVTQNGQTANETTLTLK